MLRVIRHNLMFCHQYPTRIVSAWDNVASSCVDGSFIAKAATTARIEAVGNEDRVVGSTNVNR
jgi:hypothetical protein